MASIGPASSPQSNKTVILRGLYATVRLPNSHKATKQRNNKKQRHKSLRVVYRFISIAVLVLGTSVAPVAQAALPLTCPVAPGSRYALPSLADMLERANPAVVNIATRTTVVEHNRLLADPFFRRFFNIPESRRRYRRTQSAGSGVVVDADLGYIVTNNHVSRWCRRDQRGPFRRQDPRGRTRWA